jgi:hypothetical protein
MGGEGAGVLTQRHRDAEKAFFSPRRRGERGGNAEKFFGWVPGRVEGIGVYGI